MPISASVQFRCLQGTRPHIWPSAFDTHARSGSLIGYTPTKSFWRMRTDGSSCKIEGKRPKNKMLMELRFVNHSVFVELTHGSQIIYLSPSPNFAHMDIYFIMYSVNCKFLRFEVLRAVLLTIPAWWVVTLCRWAKRSACVLSPWRRKPYEITAPNTQSQKTTILKYSFIHSYNAL
jgi:hypothetical protein